jgi:hypothetical protein
MSVVDTTTGVEYDFWGTGTLPAPGGTLAIAWGGSTRIDGNGLGSGRELRLIRRRAASGAAPSGQINHALFMYATCDRYVRLPGRQERPVMRGDRPVERQRPAARHPLPAQHDRRRDQRPQRPRLEEDDPHRNGPLRTDHGRHRLELGHQGGVRRRLHGLSARRTNGRRGRRPRPASRPGTDCRTSTSTRASTGRVDSA